MLIFLINVSLSLLLHGTFPVYIPISRKGQQGRPVRISSTSWRACIRRKENRVSWRNISWALASKSSARYVQVTSFKQMTWTLQVVCHWNSQSRHCILVHSRVLLLRSRSNSSLDEWQLCTIVRCILEVFHGGKAGEPVQLHLKCKGRKLPSTCL